MADPVVQRDASLARYEYAPTRSSAAPIPSGCLLAIVSSAPGGSSSWIDERNVPGHTQLTRIPSRAYSIAATFASWITAAFVAQYGAACDHAVSPATEAVSTIDPDRCSRMTGTAARMPLTAPRTLTRNARSQSAVSRLWMRPFGESTPALLIRTSSRPKRSTASLTTASTSLKSPTSATSVATSSRWSGSPATLASSDASLTSLSTTSVAGSPANWRDNAPPRAPPAPVIATTRRCSVIGAPSSAVPALYRSVHYSARGDRSFTSALPVDL